MDLDSYFNLIEKKIINILLRKDKEIITFDILDTDKIKYNKKIALKEKQRQMKIGEIWQEVLGNYPSYNNLKVGHKSGLDIVSHDKKIIIELKNRTNTDNHSSKQTNFEKLYIFKKENPEYRCIYGNINDKDEKTTLKGKYKIIKYKTIEIEHIIGIEFIKLILEENTTKIIDFIKNIIDKY